MAAGKTHSRFTTVNYGGQQIECSITSINGVGISYAETDITTLCSDIVERIQGYGDVSVTLSGPFNNTATTGGHVVVEPLNGSATGSTLTVAIGIGAAPTTGDPEFEVTSMGCFSYVVDISGDSPTWTAELRPLPGAAAAWGTVGS